MSAGKGSAPRNIGPKFRENWDEVFSGRKFHPICDQCGNNHHVWRNYLQGGVYWCHRIGCNQATSQRTVPSHPEV